MAHKWYIVHAYSNFEKKVAESIKEQAEQQGLTDHFEEILVPTEEVVELRRGQRVNAERKFFPGYVLVKMEMTDETYHLIKNTPKVTGFLGTANKPLPVPPPNPYIRTTVGVIIDERACSLNEVMKPLIMLSW